MDSIPGIEAKAETMKTVRMRTAAMALAAALAITTTTACIPSIGWKLGSTHGAIVEVGAKRASIGIYRVPSRAIYTVYRQYGTRAAQDVIWAVGKPPTASVTVGGLRLSLDFVRSKFHGYLYGDSNDFRGAVVDAHEADDCIALTLISQGAYIKNWTHKTTGCQSGSL